jgi:nucleotide-binding universal stress UspA family protein
MYKSVLVATDGSETAGEAVRVAIGLAKTFGATLHVANVYRSGASSRMSVPDMKMALPEGINPGAVATTQAESDAAHAKAQGVTARTHVVAGNPAERIVAIAQEENVDLIVVGNKGMRGAKRVLGSVPNSIAHTAPCAVLIVNTT